PAGCACKNVTDWVDHHAVHIKCSKASILFRPCITVVSGSKHPTSLAHNGMCSGEDVIVATINGQRRNVGRCQTYVGKRPTVAVVSGAIHACSASCCSGKDSSGRNDRQRPNVAAVQTVVYRRPAVAIVCRSENAAAKICPCKNVATRIGRQRANIGLDHVVINFYPTVSIISRAVDAASSAYKVSSYENVTIRDKWNAFIKRKQAIINLLPILSAIGLANHAAPVITGENDISRIDIWIVNL